MIKSVLKTLVYERINMTEEEKFAENLDSCMDGGLETCGTFLEPITILLEHPKIMFAVMIRYGNLSRNKSLA
jgi:hypothetical protein